MSYERPSFEKPKNKNEQLPDDVALGHEKKLEESSTETEQKTQAENPENLVDQLEGDFLLEDEKVEAKPEPEKTDSVDTSEAKLNPQENKIEKEDVSPQEQILIRRALEQIDIQNAHVAIGELKANIAEIKKYSQNIRFFKHIQERIEDLVSIMGAGQFPSFAKKLFSRLIGKKSEINKRDTGRQQIELKLGGHVDLTASLAEKISEQVLAVKNSKNRETLNSSIAQLETYSHAVKMALGNGEIIKIRNEISTTPEIFFDLGIEKRGDLVIMLDNYIKTLEILSKQIDQAVRQSTEMSEAVRGGQDMRRVVKERLVNGVLEIENYEDLVDPETLSMLKFKKAADEFIRWGANDFDSNSFRDSSAFKPRVKNEVDKLHALKDLALKLSLDDKSISLELQKAEDLARKASSLGSHSWDLDDYTKQRQNVETLLSSTIPVLIEKMTSNT